MLRSVLEAGFVTHHGNKKRKFSYSEAKISVRRSEDLRRDAILEVPGFADKQNKALLKVLFGFTLGNSSYRRDFREAAEA